MSRHPLGGALRASEEPPRAAFHGGIERLWPTAFSVQIENVGSNDQPLTGRQHDRLNRAPFAQCIASVVLALPKGAGSVVGIHGPWGDGKTTVLNLVRADLETSTDTVALEFNPWRFTDEPSMLAGFFRVLAGTIRAKLSTKGEDIAGWIETLGPVPPRPKSTRTWAIRVKRSTPSAA